MAIDPIQQDSLSRFYRVDPILFNGVSTFGKWPRPDWLKQELVNEQDILLFQVDQQYAGRPDLIAEHFYQTPFLEWVIVMFNRPLNPLGFPKAGSVIKILSRTVVFSNI